VAFESAKTIPFVASPVVGFTNPNPPLPISRDITFNAAYAEVRASVVRLSRALTDMDFENNVPAKPIIISMMVIVIINSINEKPNWPFLLLDSIVLS